MRYKIVPEPRSVEFLREVRMALPLVPDTVEDCCTRVRDRTDLQSRDVAREYLTFAQALGLADESGRGFHRTRENQSDDVLADRYRENVFGAREMLEALENGPKSVEESFDDVRDIVPRWERDRHSDWEAKWRDRSHRLLEWGRTFDLIERIDDVYQLPDGERGT